MGVADNIPNGTVRTVDGRVCIFYDGYWIRYYAPPENTLTAKKKLIDSLTRRLFHHTEPGINTPGERLDVARRAYETDANPETKRVKGAMLAGALFNRAADIFTAIVELEEKGVWLQPDNELMKQCEEYFQEALQLGKLVKHYSGHEGIDELWGEPLKAFAMPIGDFYESRYVKIAQTMRDIDRIARRLQALFRDDPVFTGLCDHIHEFAEAAKLESETMRSDPVIFEIWPRFVAAGEQLLAFRPKLPSNASQTRVHHAAEGMRIIRDGKDLLTYLAGARVPMPKSTRQFFGQCDGFERTHGSPFDRRRSRRA